MERRARRDCFVHYWGSSGRGSRPGSPAVVWARRSSRARFRRKPEEAHPGEIPAQLGEPPCDLFSSNGHSFIAGAKRHCFSCSDIIWRPSRIEMPRSLAQPRPNAG